MARPSTTGLTDYELSIMTILWNSKEPLSVAEILELIEKEPKPAYTSLLTIVRNMEKKGYVSHAKDAKAFIYSPKLKKETYKKTEIGKLKERFFGGSTLELAVNLIREEKLKPREIEHLRKLLEEL